MLDSETKRRIDSARDILVGKVPDPKSQVEQITIALIYKFMDDMDKQSIEMGGKASFFKGEFKKYGWGNIFDPRLGGVEMLNLYGEAITRMSQNANLPELFRNIFKNAYLPYRDPETLKLFLKTINDFTYDHSEKLGDAFEYLLSVLGSQGDAGQFRTPRHIIDFMVQVIDPKKNETVLDPACGTAGFLISAYKHIVKSSQESGKPLNAQDKQKLYENFTGYDISPDMVRLSLVNLYLHGFVKPQIHEYDSLASEERWNEYADVILANPPFMSPKGGIMPHKKFSVQSNRSEVLFVDYMAEHLTPNGRAAIIVPEGIIFQSAGAYKQLRKYLIEHNFLWAVVSLPAGMFNPYAGVKTSILLLDKSLAKKTDKILFVKVENDGFDLGAQRRPIDRNDLPKTLKVLNSFKASILDGKTDSFALETDTALLVSISKLAETGDYILSADRYREVIRFGKQTHRTVKMEDICEIERGASPRPIDKFITEDSNGVNWIKIGDGSSNSMYISSTKEKITLEGAEKSRRVKKGDFILSNSMSFGHPYILDIDGCVHDGWLILRPKGDDFIKEYLYYILGSDEMLGQFKKLATGGVVNNLNSNLVRNVEIPLPSLETQRQLVDEIAGHQRIIDGARQVVESWNSNLEVELAECLPDGMDDWESVKLGDVCLVQDGTHFSPENGETGEYKYITAKNIKPFYIDLSNLTYVSKEAHKSIYARCPVEKGDILYIKDGATAGIAAINTLDEEFSILSSVALMKPHKDKLDNLFLLHYLNSEFGKKNFLSQVGGVAITRLTLIKLKNTLIPLPRLEIQREIVARIESERAIVEGNRELVRLYEAKVKKVIERVWEG